MLTAQEARLKAIAVLGQAAAGIDLAADRDAAKADHSFQTIYERFDETHFSVRLKENVAADYRRIFKIHVLPRSNTSPSARSRSRTCFASITAYVTRRSTPTER